MAWLLLGATFLLLAAGAGKETPRFDALALAGLACFVAAGAWSFRVYAPLAALLILAASLFPAMLILRLVARRVPPAARLGLLAAGAAAMLFALFGPADGLF